MESTTPAAAQERGRSPLLEMRGIVKRFAGVVANDRVDFDVRAGEVHSLFGENGAGKSTLMRVLYGLHRPDEGEIRVNGERVTIDSPADAIRLGIGMIHQHFMLVNTLTVAENVALGLPSTRGPMTDLDRVAARVRELAATYRLNVDPQAVIWQLSVGERQRVEIVKALYRNVGLLVLDEPTAFLTPQEVDDLFEVLRRMADDGKGLVFISHKVREVLGLSARITVLRAGRTVGTLPASEASRDRLVEMMVGHALPAEEPASEIRRDRAAALPAEEPASEMRRDRTAAFPPIGAETAPAGGGMGHPARSPEVAAASRPGPAGTAPAGETPSGAARPGGAEPATATRPGESPSADARLAIAGLRVRGDRGAEAVRGLSLEVRSGEIVGIAGVSGNGQRELAESIAGLRRPTEGSILLEGTELAGGSPAHARSAGLGYVPEERMRDGVVGDFSVAENLLLVDNQDQAFSRWGFLRPGPIRRHCEQLVADFDIRTPNLETRARNLSGGNIQKLIMARELSRAPRVLLVAQPTRGIDVAAAQYIHGRLREQRGQGTAVLIISEDLDEVMSLADRVLVMYEGEIIGTADPRVSTRAAIGLLMAGVRAEQPRPETAAAPVQG